MVSDLPVAGGASISSTTSRETFMTTRPNSSLSIDTNITDVPDVPDEHALPTNFLNLPEELLSQIILYLHPREAIFLSLTCRALYHGVLSEHNHYIWYALGSFANGAQDPLPAWLECIFLSMSSKYSMDEYNFSDMKMPLSRDVSGGKLDLPTQYFLDCKSEENVKRFQVGLEYIIEAMQDITPMDTLIAPGRTARSLDRHYRMPPRNIPSVFVPGWYYKRVLVGTMLGLDDLGCQWCLRTWWKGSPPKSWGKLRMKLCNDCFRSEMLPMQALDELPEKITKRLKAEEWLVIKELGWDGLSDLSSGRIWRHKVEKVVREVLGSNMKLDDMLLPKFQR